MYLLVKSQNPPNEFNEETIKDISNEKNTGLDATVKKIQTELDKPVIIGLSFPSSSDNLALQASVYDLMLNAINQRDWVSGFISRGYYQPVKLQDQTSSVHGKPASEVIEQWFMNWTLK